MLWPVYCRVDQGRDGGLDSIVPRVRGRGFVGGPVVFCGTSISYKMSKKTQYISMTEQVDNVIAIYNLVY